TMDTLEEKCIDLYFGGNKEVAHEAMQLPMGEKVYMRDASFDYVSRTDVTPILDEMTSDFLGETFTPKEWADRNEDEFKLFMKVDDTGKEEIIGFCLLAYQGIDTDDKDDPRNSPLVGNIWWFAIRKKFRGQGYGTAIYPYILKYLKNEKHMRAVITTYRAKNVPAGKLYMKFGLKPYGEVIQIPHRPGSALTKLPEGFDFYKSGEKVGSRVKDELDEFVKNHMSCKGPDWISSSVFNISGKNAFMLRRDETGKIVSLVTMNTRMFNESDSGGDKPQMVGNLFYPMATDEREFKLLMDTALHIKAFDKVNSVYCVFGKEHPYKGILYKYGKTTSIKLAKKL
ncbi:MAG: GNAT family N-acetyltransferase, partial [Bacilli bacterium]|nr:GNAT family N-acetyltransferase [Bacilli bacterium]